jgi:hypothetical protein
MALCRKDLPTYALQICQEFLIEGFLNMQLHHNVDEPIIPPKVLAYRVRKSQARLPEIATVQMSGNPGISKNALRVLLTDKDTRLL